MGRGSRDSAVAETMTPRGLLYGRRQLGYGPAITEEEKRPSLSGLSWNDYVNKVYQVCVDAGLGQASEINIEQSQPSSGNRRTHRLLIKGDNHQYQVNPIEDNGLRGVAIAHQQPRQISGYQLEDEVLPSGDQSCSNDRQLIELLEKPFDRAGLDFVETPMSGNIILARLDRGDKIDIAPGIWENNSDDDLDPVQARRSAAKRMVSRAGDNGLLNLDQHHSLNRFLDNTKDDFLTTLAGDILGRRIIANRPALKVRVSF